MASLIKKTTNIAGLAVSKNPHKILGILYDKIIRTCQKMPADAVYRQHTQAIIQGRLAMVSQEVNISKLEEKINCGQIEEVIVQAEKELSLARKMLQWQPWKPLEGAAPSGQWKWPVSQN